MKDSKVNVQIFSQNNFQIQTKEALNLFTLKKECNTQYMEEKNKKKLTPTEKKEQKKYQIIIASIGLSVATFFTLLSFLIHHL